jgi:hypothetical protein
VCKVFIALLAWINTIMVAINRYPCRNFHLSGDCSSLWLRF